MYPTAAEFAAPKPAARPLARWTVGDTTPDGFDCLRRSADSLTRLYDVEVVVCYNGDSAITQEALRDFALIDQRRFRGVLAPEPVGVAWKLYPPRLAPDRHELVIDNDLIVSRRLPELDAFFSGVRTLLLGENGRTYGRFGRHVPAGYGVNSGLYGMPPGFDFGSFVRFYAGGAWEENALAEHRASRTFDEQGLVALALLSRPHLVIPAESVTNCEHRWVPGAGHHFVGLNRRAFHRPYREYVASLRKLYL